MSDGRFGHEIFKAPAQLIDVAVKPPRVLATGSAWYANGWLKDDFDWGDVADLRGTDSTDDLQIRDLTGQPFPGFLPKKRKNAGSAQRFWYSVRTRDVAAGTSIGL